MEASTQHHCFDSVDSIQVPFSNIEHTGWLQSARLVLSYHTLSCLVSFTCDLSLLSVYFVASDCGPTCSITPGVMLRQATNQTAKSPTVNLANDEVNTDVVECSRLGKPLLPLNPWNKLLSSVKMPSCLPCVNVDPNRKASKDIEKQLNNWSKKESKVIQLLLIGRHRNV